MGINCLYLLVSVLISAHGQVPPPAPAAPATTAENAQKPKKKATRADILKAVETIDERGDLLAIDTFLFQKISPTAADKKAYCAAYNLPQVHQRIMELNHKFDFPRFIVYPVMYDNIIVCGLTQAPEMISVLRKQALFNLLRGNEARKWYTESIRKDPESNIPFRYQIATSYWAEGNWSQFQKIALGAIKASSPTKPQDAQTKNWIHHLLAQTYLIQGQTANFESHIGQVNPAAYTGEPELRTMVEVTKFQKVILDSVKQKKTILLPPFCKNYASDVLRVFQMEICLVARYLNGETLPEREINALGLEKKTPLVAAQYFPSLLILLSAHKYSPKALLERMNKFDSKNPAQTMFRPVLDAGRQPVDLNSDVIKKMVAFMGGDNSLAGLVLKKAQQSQ